MKKYLEIRFENGAIWGIPLEQIAEHRAKYYAEKDPETTYEEEFNYAMEDKWEAIHWFQNNMNWEDVLAQEIVKPKLFNPKDHLLDGFTSMRINGQE